MMLTRHKCASPSFFVFYFPCLWAYIVLCIHSSRTAIHFLFPFLFGFLPALRHSDFGILFTTAGSQASNLFFVDIYLLIYLFYGHCITEF